MGISVIDMCHFLTNPNFYGVLIRKEEKILLLLILVIIFSKISVDC